MATDKVTKFGREDFKSGKVVADVLYRVILTMHCHRKWRVRGVNNNNNLTI